MEWIPTAKERKYIELVISMSTDCLMGRGTQNADTYCLNLIMISKAIGDLVDGKAAQGEGER